MHELPVDRPQTFATGQDDPEIHVYRDDSELNKRARQIGTIAGQVVARVRHAGRYARSGQPVGDLRDKASSRAGAIRDQISIRAEEWRQVFRERSAELGRRARAGYGDARYRADQWGRNYPWHLLLVAGIAGIVLGAALRVRRAGRAI